MPNIANRDDLRKAKEPAILLSDVRLTLASTAGPVNILNGVSLNVVKGEAVALVGPSGSGKSSLLMVAAGLEAASSGSVAVAGQNLSGLSEDALARFRRAHIGIIFQAFHLIPSMTALENVAVPLELMSDSDAFARARSALDAVGLNHRLSHYPGQLSGGEQQRVALARAIVHDPEILFADEPTGNLDGPTGTQVMDLLFALKARCNATLFLVTHEDALAHRCDRILRMKDGVIVADSPRLAALA
ncbi:MAG: ABC transporter ATP-binding protein [Alphaproteobacteria bacterium]|nr:ABC transporter ATP-binding protein [Alphaproteobacteria bacterium]